MTLFISYSTKRSRIVYEISDIYLMTLTFLISFAVTKILKEVIKRLTEKKLKLPNPRGGGSSIQLSDDDELALTILSCIADNELYLVKSKKLKQLIFALVKGEIKNESLGLTPNLIRFLALRLLNPDKSLIVKVGNLILLSSNRARLFFRLKGSALIGVIGALCTTLPYAILLVILYFDFSSNCGYDCSSHFEILPKESSVIIYSDDSTGHLIIGDKNQASQVQIYNPIDFKNHKSVKNVKEQTFVKEDETVTREYKRSSQKYKQVDFADFKEKDPMLSQFKDLQEPEVPQVHCLVDGIRDLIDIRIE